MLTKSKSSKIFDSIFDTANAALQNLCLWKFGSQLVSSFMKVSSTMKDLSDLQCAMRVITITWMLYTNLEKFVWFVT